MCVLSSFCFIESARNRYIKAISSFRGKNADYIPCPPREAEEINFTYITINLYAFLNLLISNIINNFCFLLAELQAVCMYVCMYTSSKKR